MAKLDQDVVNLAKAIRQVETGNRPVSGASGELKSRYQYMPATWKATAKKYLGDENAPLTLENENKASYLKIKDWKDSGYKPDQIASMWNSGSPEWEGKVGTNKAGVKYDVPAYVKKVGAEYSKIKKASAFSPIEYTPPPGPSAQRQGDYDVAQAHNALFAPNTENPGYVSEGLKTVGNIPTSAFGFVKGALDLLNPVSTLDKLKTSAEMLTEIQNRNKQTGANYDDIARMQNELIQEYQNKKAQGEDVSNLENFFKGQGVDPSQFQTSEGAPSAFGQLASAVPGAAYETIVPPAARGLVTAGAGAFQGDGRKIDEGLETAQRELVSDPVGSIAPFLIAGRYAAGKLNKGAAFDAAVSRVAEPVIRPIRAVGQKVGATTRFGVGQATGLQPETIRQVVENPESFTRASRAAIDRISLGKEVQSSLARRLSAIRDTGALYEPIRSGTTKVNVSKNWLESTLKEETGLTIKNGKFQASAGSKLRASSDVRALQSLYNTYKSTFRSGKMTPNEFLNFRADLADLARFERQIGKSKPVETVTKSIRKKFNEAYRNQVKGLKELDSEYAPQIKELKNLSKGIVNKEGQLTDAAINRIANATGKGKDLLLKRLEDTTPGITQKIKVLKAVEDIQNAAGIKVGTYSRTGLIAGAGLGLGILQGIITAILTSPEVAVPMLRQLGVLKNSTAVKQIIQGLKQINEIPENLPTTLKKDVTDIKLKAGLSIEDVSGGKPSAFAPKPKPVSKSTYYHGTQAKGFGDFDGITYLTKDPIEAQGFAQGVHLGGGRGGVPRVVEVNAKIRRTKNIDKEVSEALEGGDVDVTIAKEIKKAKKEGYDAVEFEHPSNYTDGYFTATVPVDNALLKQTGSKNVSTGQKATARYNEPMEKIETITRGAAKYDEKLSRSLTEFENDALTLPELKKKLRQLEEGDRISVEDPALYKQMVDDIKALENKPTTVIEPMDKSTPVSSLAEKLMEQESAIWRRLGIRSGGQLENNARLKIKYEEAVQKIMPDEVPQRVIDLIENENYNTLAQRLSEYSKIKPTETAISDWLMKYADDYKTQEGLFRAVEKKFELSRPEAVDNVMDFIEDVIPPEGRGKWKATKEEPMGTPEMAQEQLLDAHMAAIGKKNADAFNIGWASEDGLIASKTSKGIVETELKNGKYVTKWYNED